VASTGGDATRERSAEGSAEGSAEEDGAADLSSDGDETKEEGQLSESSDLA
jgi:hypothetical protein